MYQETRSRKRNILQFPLRILWSIDLVQFDTLFISCDSHIVLKERTDRAAIRLNEIIRMHSNRQDRRLQTKVLREAI